MESTQSNKKNVITIVIWQGLSMLIRFSSNIVLAWLIAPESFGLIALVLVTINGLFLLSDVGIRVSLIRSKKGNEPVFYNTARTINIIRGIILSIIVYFISPYIADFYNQSELEPLLAFTGLTLAIRGAESIGIHLAIRAQKLQRMVLLELITQIITTIVTILVALQVASAWAFSIGMVAGLLMRTLLSYRFFAGYGFKLNLDMESVKDIINFGKWVFISTLFGFFSMQADRIILGKYISIDMLGIYYLSFILVSIPNEIVGKISENILYPYYSKIFRDNNNDRSAFFEKRLSILTFMFLLGSMVLALSTPFYSFLYATQYHEAIYLIPYLSLFIWFVMVQSTLDRAILAVGDSQQLAYSNAFTFITRVAFALIGLSIWEIKGFICGLAIGASIGCVYVGMWIKRRCYFQFSNDLVYTIAFISLAVLVGISNSVFGASIFYLPLVVFVYMLLVIFILNKEFYFELMRIGSR